MAMISLEVLKNEAAKIVQKERYDKLRDTLTSQMRTVERARQVLANEELKLKDIEARIEEGSL